MEEHFSPLDTRYAKYIPSSLSEESTLKFQIEVEKQWLLAIADSGIAPSIKAEELEEAFHGVSFAEIEEIEAKTQHATRALVEVLANRLKNVGREDLSHWVHVGLTSFDTVDTAQRLKLKNYLEIDFFPLISRFKKILVEKAKKYKNTRQVGRTHGQWAVPTIFGLSFAEGYERISRLSQRLRGSLSELSGQSSGAIGGYHASALLVEDPLKLEENFLKRLDLKAHYASLQTLPPEDFVACAQDVYAMASVAAKFAHDLRHLARSEINEIREGFKKGQVGSSTMPQKRNPWNLEHVCSLFKVLGSRLQLLEQDMLTEHQRDLTNSATGRFYFEFFSVAHMIFLRLSNILEGLEVVEERMSKNLEDAGSSVLAEAFYVLATKNGIPDAHSVVREAARKSEREGTTLWDCARDEVLKGDDLSLEDLQAKILRGSQLKLEKILKNESH